MRLESTKRRGDRDIDASSMSDSVNSSPPDNTGGYVLESVAVVLAIVFAVLRFYVRAVTKAGLWWDDWLILVAVLATVLNGILSFWGMLLFFSSTAFA